MRLLKKKKIEKEESVEQSSLVVVKKNTKTMVSVAPKRVLYGAHVSEKAAGIESTGVYMFTVAQDASKIEIKQAVFAHYGVMPTQVRVMHVEGKRVRFGQTFGKRGDWKKAVVTLPEGKHIDVHSGI